MPDSSTARMRRRPSQERSKHLVECILNATRQLIGEAGADTVQTRAVAERAGVSVGSLYQYFPNREALLTAVWSTDSRSQFREAVKARVPLAEISPEESMRRYVRKTVRGHLRRLADDPAIYAKHVREFDSFGELSTSPASARTLADAWARLLVVHGVCSDVEQAKGRAALAAGAVHGALAALVELAPHELSDETAMLELEDAAVRMLVGARNVRDESRSGVNE